MEAVLCTFSVRLCSSHSDKSDIVLVYRSCYTAEWLQHMPLHQSMCNLSYIRYSGYWSRCVYIVVGNHHKL
jgi:hypothetical protein